MTCFILSTVDWGLGCRLKVDFSVFFTSELNAGSDTLAHVANVYSTLSIQSSFFTLKNVLLLEINVQFTTASFGSFYQSCGVYMFMG